MLLERQAEALAAAGLHRVSVSLDTLEPALFARLTGKAIDPEHIVRGIEAAHAADLGPVKINCVVQRGLNEHAVVELVQRFGGTGHIVRFIEFMDVGTLNGWRAQDTVTAVEILERLRTLGPLRALEPAHRSEVAQRYAFEDGTEVGIIASVSQPFCGDCTRVRLTADGRLVTCLFSSGA